MVKSMDNRMHRITLRVTEKELGKIRDGWKKSSDVHLSGYLRKVLLGQPVRVFTYDRSRDHFMEEAGSLRRELSALGNNFNQVVRQINTVHHSASGSFWLKTAASMQKELVNKTNSIQLLLEKMWDSW